MDIGFVCGNQKVTWGWRGGSVVKNTEDLVSQHAHGGSQPSPVPGGLTPSSVLYGHQACK